ncbi:hypothetical protein EBZ38_13475 [bacterium]|nr:hypothetical protein [bacterium]
MAEAKTFTSITKLDVGADGRSSPNFSSWEFQVLNHLQTRFAHSYPLDSIVLGLADGVAPTNPGSFTAWKALSNNTGKTQDDYNAAVTTYNTQLTQWRRANACVFEVLMTTIPQRLHPAAAQHSSSAKSFWDYLRQLFKGHTTTSIAHVIPSLHEQQLSDFPCAADWITKINSIAAELEENGLVYPPQHIAACMIATMGDAYPVTKALLLKLPKDQLLPEVVAGDILAAERNHAAEQAVALNAGRFKPTKGGERPFGKLPPCSYVRQTGSRKGLTCGGTTHTSANCFKKKTDEWVRANPGKAFSEMPDWGAEFRARRALNTNAAEHSLPSANNVSVQTLVDDVRVADLFENMSVSNEIDLAYTLADSTSAALSSLLSSVQDSGVVESNSASDSSLVDLEFVLDSGCTDPMLKDLIAPLRPHRSPVHIQGAGTSMLTTSLGSSTLPCPAYPEQQVTGYHVPDFRHNLLSIRHLQAAGVQVVFPAHATSAHLSTSDGKDLCSFQLTSKKLYTLRVPRNSAAHLTSPNSASSPPCACPQHTISNPTILHHHRLGHPNFKYLSKLASQQLVRGLPTSLPLPPSLAGPSCTVCVESKLQAVPHPSSPSRAAAKLDLVHMDLWGPAPVKTPQGHAYSLTLVDDHTRMGNVYLLRHKSDAATAIKTWAAKVHNLFGKKVQRFHSDGGGEFLNRTLSTFFAVEGIQHTYTLPNSPEQNGVAEARNKHLVKMARCLLLAANAPRHLWGYALQHAAVVHNYLPHALIPDMTPHECWTGRKPDVSRLRIWGSTAHVLLNQDQQRRSGGKLGPRSKPHVFVGLNLSSPGWLFLDPETQREVRSQDVQFDETRPFYSAIHTPVTHSSWLEFCGPDAPLQLHHTRHLLQTFHTMPKHHIPSPLHLHLRPHHCVLAEQSVHLHSTILTRRSGQQAPWGLLLTQAPCSLCPLQLHQCNLLSLPGVIYSFKRTGLRRLQI